MAENRHNRELETREKKTRKTSLAASRDTLTLAKSRAGVRVSLGTS